MFGVLSQAAASHSHAQEVMSAKLFSAQGFKALGATLELGRCVIKGPSSFEMFSLGSLPDGHVK